MSTDQEQHPPQAADNASSSPAKGLKRQLSQDQLDKVGRDSKEPKRAGSPLKNGSGENGTTANNNAKTTPKHERKSSGNEQTHDENVLETGTILFSYKPVLGVDEASSLAEVQVFHVILEPDSEQQQQQEDGKKGESAPKTRLIKIGKKKLPDCDAKERFWAHVVTAKEDMAAMEPKLDSNTYETATVVRTVKSDRIAGKGKYVIAKRDGRRTNLGFVLQAPEEVGPVQQTFNIGKEGSYSLAVKNPSKGNPPQAGLPHSQKADFPQELKAKFSDYQWIPVEPALLDYVGCEMVWIGSSDNLEHDFGEEIAMEVTTTSNGTEENGTSEEKKNDKEEVDGKEKALEVMKEVHLDPKDHPIQPLVDGQWPKGEDAPEKNKKDDDKDGEGEGEKANNDKGAKE